MFLSVPNAKRVEIYKGLGTPLPLCAVCLLLATAARGIGIDGASCEKSIHRDEPLTQGSEERLFGAVLKCAATNGREDKTALRGPG